MATVTHSKGAGAADIACLQATRCSCLSIKFGDHVRYVASDRGVFRSLPKVEIVSTSLGLVESDIK